MKNKYNDMNLDELKKTHEDLLEEAMNLRFHEVIGQLNNPMRKRIVRRSLARINTILNEYKLGIRKQKENK
ncbi:MAG: 50S ribosomal protein L29 [Spirochaetes bacterium]|nr:50S ribosomal protein L29 [Spirochaetota bacterium]